MLLASATASLGEFRGYDPGMALGGANVDGGRTIIDSVWIAP